MSQSIHTSDFYYSTEDLKSFGFSTVGNDCRISKKVSFYSIAGSIGDNVRIDDYCVVKGHIELGSHIHIGAFSLLSGVGGGVHLADFVTLSSGVHVYSASDIYAASTLASSSVPRELTSTKCGPIHLEAATLVGANTLILPGTRLGMGASIGAQCIVKGSIPRGAIIVNREALGEQIGFRDVGQIEQYIHAAKTDYAKRA